MEIIDSMRRACECHVDHGDDVLIVGQHVKGGDDSRGT
jgi:hypothetical protein